jgi:NTE family protein
MMILQFFRLLLLLTALITSPLYGAERQKIGLVLSGGGARGAAHVGVLKVLEDLRIPIDVIAGTSMGSIVGGLYASGLSPAQIEQILDELDWDDVLADDQSRVDLSPNKKFQEDLFSLGISPGFEGGQLKLPPGAIQGQKIELALQRLTIHVAHINEFDNLAIPFRAVATDIVDGNEVILKHGNLGRAMRASMSVPSIFAAIEIDGHLLVDGGIVNNLPVSVARGMGADILIVVDIGAPLRNREEIGNILTVTNQLTRILTGRNVIASLDSLKETDILISPDLGDITSAQFNRSAEAIPKGEHAARMIAERLQTLSLSSSDYEMYLAGLNQISIGDRTVKSISLRNESSINDNVVARRLNINKGDPLNLDQLEHDIGQIHGLGAFEKVGYDLAQYEDGVGVMVYATPKSWGPNYLHFGLDMEADFSGDTATNMILGYSRSEVNQWAGEWTTLLQVGQEPKLLSYLHQPLGLDLSYFVQPSFSVERTNIGVFSGDHETAQYQLRQSEFQLVVGKEFGASAVFSLGVNRRSGEVKVAIGDPNLPESDFDDGGAIASFSYDSINDIDYPSRGAVFNLSYYHALDSLGADEEYQQWRLRTGIVKTFGDKHTIGILTSLGGTEDGTASISRRFLLGGFLNMSGLQVNQLSGEYAGLATAFYYRKFNRFKIFPAYIGGSAEYGGAWADRDDISAKSSLFGGSLFLGVDSPLGPVLLGLGRTNEGDSVFFTKIGRFFN